MWRLAAWPADWPLPTRGERAALALFIGTMVFQIVASIVVIIGLRNGASPPAGWVLPAIQLLIFPVAAGVIEDGLECFKVRMDVADDEGAHRRLRR